MAIHRDWVKLRAKLKRANDALGKARKAHAKARKEAEKIVEKADRSLIAAVDSAQQMLADLDATPPGTYPDVADNKPK
jgi:uncharacterized protein YutE (UPF0331/DUF86 family)